MSSKHHVYWYRGPVEVRRGPGRPGPLMIGHRTPDFAELFASIQSKLKQAFLTENRVYVSGSSGSGLWEGAIRNSVRDDRAVLHLVGGAFSERWADVSRANGKRVEVISVDWGRAITPELVEDALKQGEYDAVCLVHNETSTGVVNPVREIGEVVRRYEGTLFLVDTVSGFLGAESRRRMGHRRSAHLLAEGLRAAARPGLRRRQRPRAGARPRNRAPGLLL